MWLRSLGERTGEQEDTEHLGSLCLALLATKQMRAAQSISQMVNSMVGGLLPQFVVYKVRKGSMLSHNLQMLLLDMDEN